MGDIERILNEFHTIAVVGASPDPDRASNHVFSYLSEHGYNAIPVNPTTKEVSGKKAYPSLASIPGKVEVVDIFRRSEETPAIVDEAIKIGAKAVWMQEGVVNAEAEKKARAAGLLFVSDRCMLKEHRRLKGP